MGREPVGLGGRVPEGRGVIQWICIIALLFLANTAGRNGLSTDCAIFVAAAILLVAQDGRKRVQK